MANTSGGCRYIHSTCHRCTFHHGGVFDIRRNLLAHSKTLSGSARRISVVGRKRYRLHCRHHVRNSHSCESRSDDGCRVGDRGSERRDVRCSSGRSRKRRNWIGRFNQGSASDCRRRISEHAGSETAPSTVGAQKYSSKYKNSTAENLMSRLVEEIL